MPIRFVIEREASVTRPSWDGWSLCLQWGALTDESGKIDKRGYRNIWRDASGRLFTGRAQSRLPSKAITDELWEIARNEGWANMAGDGADQWYRVFIPGNDVAEMSANGLVNAFSKSRRNAGLLPDDAPVFHGKTKDSDYIFYFSPAAANVAEELLPRFSATTCREPDAGDLRNLKRLK